MKCEGGVVWTVRVDTHMYMGHGDLFTRIDNAADRVTFYPNSFTALRLPVLWDLSTLYRSHSFPTFLSKPQNLSRVVTAKVKIARRVVGHDGAP